MPEVAAPVTLKCKVCGGDIVRDYLAGACVCANCGNKWPLAEMIPDYQKYAHAVELLGKGKELLNGKADTTTAAQAKLFFERASTECLDSHDAIAAEILKVCQQGKEQAKQVTAYARGTSYYDKKNYKQALSEYKKIPGYKDVDERVEECNKQILILRKKHIPLAIVVGMVIPAVLCILLKEKVGLPLFVDIPIFLVLSAGLAYVVYLEGTWATVIEVLSFICAVPLILFMIMAYGLHIDTRTAAILSVGIPIGIIAAVAFLPERTS